MRTSVPASLLASALVFALVHCGSDDDGKGVPVHGTDASTDAPEGGEAGGAGGTSGTGGTSGSGATSGSGGTGGGVAGAGTTGGTGGSSVGGTGGSQPGCDDPDQDGYGTGPSCLGPDCEPLDSTVHPGAEELCNGVDDDCSGEADDGVTCKPRLWVYVLAGQSNMVGLGFNNELPASEQGPVPGAHIYYNDSVHTNPKAEKWGPLTPGFGVSADRFGPELTFGRRLRELRPDQTVAIIKIAEGGTALHDRWKAVDGDLYKLMLAEVNKQMQDLTVEWRPQLVGFLWMQGESDAIQSSAANAYAANFRQFIFQSRTDTGRLMATTAALIKPSSLWPYATTVRNATTLVATQAGQMDTIETQDLQVQPADLAHYDSAGFIAMGRRFAESIHAQLGTHWSFETGLGAAQGDGYWTSRARTGSDVVLLTWDPGASVWKGNNGVVIGKGTMHPGPTSAAELGWWAPFAGKVSASVAIEDADPAGGDGVHVEIVRDGQVAWAADVPNGGAVATSVQANVVQGQELVFRTSSGPAQDPSHDSTTWKIDIEMTAVE